MAVVLLVVNLCATILLFLRLYIRLRLTKSCGWDDRTIFVGWASTSKSAESLPFRTNIEIQILQITVVSGILNSIYNYGTGDHVVFVTPAQLTDNKKWAFIIEIMIFSSNMFIKLSVGLFLLRIFTTKKRRIWFIYTINVFTILTNGSAAVAILCQCRPIEKIYNPMIPGTCIPLHVASAITRYQGGKNPNCSK